MMPRILIVVSLVGGGMGLGCGEANNGSGGEVTVGSSGSGSTGGLPTTSASGEAATGGSSTSSGSMPGSSGGSSAEDFIAEPDVPVVPQCDPFMQDCPEGQKCTIWSSDGASLWDGYRCVDVVGDQVPGEVCMTTDGSAVSGNDDCVKGAMCWDVSAENIGVCVALCTGSQDWLECAEGFACTIAGDGVLIVCLPQCDPLAQDCPGGDLCLPVGDEFSCKLDASGDEGQVFDGCTYANSCDPGLVCASTDSAAECDPRADGCCVPMCSISAMAACPGVGQECVSLWEPGMAPAPHEDIGFCTLPG